MSEMCPHSSIYGEVCEICKAVDVISASHQRLLEAAKEAKRALEQHHLHGASLNYAHSVLTQLSDSIEQAKDLQ